MKKRRATLVREKAERTIAAKSIAQQQREKEFREQAYRREDGVIQCPPARAEGYGWGFVFGFGIATLPGGMRG